MTSTERLRFTASASHGHGRAPPAKQISKRKRIMLDEWNMASSSGVATLGLKGESWDEAEGFIAGTAAHMYRRTAARLSCLAKTISAREMKDIVRLTRIPPLRARTTWTY